MNIDVPCVRWRMGEEESWRARTEELWHEDIDVIQVKLPSWVTGQGSLSLGNGGQRLDRKFKHGVASFDLRKFADSIRENGAPVQEIILSLADGTITSSVLLKVRSLWQVAKVGFIDREVEGMRELRIHWEDRGRAENRVVRLWPLKMSDIKMVQCNIPEAASEIIVVKEVDKLPDGIYRLQFDLDDPWTTENPIFPEMNSLNCKDVSLGLGQYAGDLAMEDRLDITFFSCGRQLYNVDEKYWIEDIEPAPEFEGEKRYKGKVFTNIKGSQVQLDCNPVSFYYEDDSLPFLVDYQEDGAMFCLRCRRFFWEVIHSCPKKYHVEPETILVRRRNNES